MFRADYKNGYTKKENGLYLRHNDIVIPRGELTLVLENIYTKKQDILTIHNMVVTFGKNAIAQRLSGDSGAGEITYCAVGTGTTAPALGDTGLQTELYRKLISLRSFSNNVATFEVFFTTSEANGSLREFGLFGNANGRTASATPGSGQLYCRTAGTRTKTTSDTLYISWTVTIG